MKQYLDLMRHVLEHGDRKTGWIEIDWCGNAIGWVPDGTVIRPNTVLTRASCRA